MNLASGFGSHGHEVGSVLAGSRSWTEGSLRGVHGLVWDQRMVPEVADNGRGDETRRRRREWRGRHREWRAAEGDDVKFEKDAIRSSLSGKLASSGT